MPEARRDDKIEIGKVIETLVDQVEHDYPPPRVKRDAHPKMHGCVQAEFHVEKALPAHLQHGIFKNLGHTYLAWVRFSNAFHIEHDLKYETRGMAVKLLDVRARNIVNNDGETQDFLFATHDIFFLPNTEHYDEFAKAAAAGPTKIFFFFLRRKLFRGFWSMLKSAVVIASNPLAIQYYSQTPYRLGSAQAVKLQVAPHRTAPLERSLPGRLPFAIRMMVANAVIFLFGLPLMSRLLTLFEFQANKGSAEDFCDRYIAPRDQLRLAMMSFLSEHDAWFDVMVQLRPEADKTLSEADNTFIEDATKRWKSTFEKVATIHIPRQVFWPEPGMPLTIVNKTTEMIDLGENMSFNPWHALPEHEPLGDINRARRRVYEAIVRTRHRLNSVPMPVPTEAAYNRIKSVVQFGNMSVK
jgi:hypothetical protein